MSKRNILVFLAMCLCSCNVFSFAPGKARRLGAGRAAIGVPWFNVTSPVFGAKCDGVNDDTVAIQKALTASNQAHGGAVLIPVTTHGCLVKQNLVMDGFANVAVIGFAGSQWNGTTRPLLTFSGTTSPLISAKDSNGLRFEGLNITYSNPAFNGRVLDFESGTAVSQGAVIRSTIIQGTSAAAGALCLVCLDGSDDMVLEGVKFDHAMNAVKGTSSVAITIRNSYFSTSTGTISGSFIKDLGSDWLVEGDSFELGTALGNPNVIDCSVSCGSNLLFIGNWVGDAPPGYNGVFFKAIATGGGASYTFVGNQLIAGSNLQAKMFTTGSGMAGLVFIGNWAADFLTAFEINNAVLDVNISGNNWGAITTFLGGSAAFFYSGYVLDNTGRTKIWGEHSMASVLSFGCSGTASSAQTVFLASNGVGPTTCTNTTGAVAKIVMPSEGTIRNLRCVAGAPGVNASSGAVTLLKNGTAEPLTCTFGTRTTCTDINASHNFPLAGGDILQMKVTAQPGETLGDVNCSVGKY